MGRFRNRSNTVKVILVLILAIMTLSMSGCWNRREVEDLNFVSAIGIDRIVVADKPKYLVSLITLKSVHAGIGAASTAQPSPGSQGVVLSMEGDTVYDAFRNFALRNSRQMFLAHALVLVIGEETARGGIDEILEFCLHHRDIRNRTWVVVCEGLARDALQVHPEIESIISVEIDKVINKNQPLVDKTISSDIRWAAYCLVTPGLELTTTNMLIIPLGGGRAVNQPGTASPVAGGGSSPEGTGGSTASSGEVLPQNKSFMLSGAAVFQDDRLVGRFNEEETQGKLFITGPAREGIIPFAFGAPEKNASYLYRDVKSRITPVVNEDRSLQFEISLKGTGELLEQNNAVIDFSREDLNAAEELINQEVERRCLMAIARAQELNTDVFGFGDKLHRTEPAVWKEVQEQWGEVFPTLPVSVKANLKIGYTGLSDNPILVE